MKPFREFIPWIGLGLLVAVEIGFLYPLVKTLIQVAFTSWTWPHLIADSAVFLQQQPLHEGSAGWIQLFNPVNEHRVVISRFIGVLPLSFGGELGAWSVSASLLTLALSAALIFSILRELHRDASLPMKLMVWLLCVLVLFNPWQLENLIWDINVHWFVQGLLLLLAMQVLLRTRQAPPLWLDLLLPPVALLNGGLGIALLLAYGVIRLLAYPRRWLLLAAAAISVVMYVSTSLGGAGTSLALSGIFSWRMLQVWWPSVGLWLAASLAFAALVIALNWSRLERAERIRLLICMMPAAYAAGFAVMVDLSRSAISAGLVMRSSYVTPALMVGLSAIFLVWTISGLRSQWRWMPFLQAGWLLLLALPREPWPIAPGLKKQHFSRQVSRLINEQDRRITWFHCAQMEAGQKQRNCQEIPFYDGWNVIRTALKQPLSLGLGLGTLPATEARQLLRAQHRTDLERFYLVRSDQPGHYWIVGRRQGQPQPGDLVLGMAPGQAPRHWQVIP